MSLAWFVISMMVLFFFMDGPVYLQRFVRLYLEHRQQALRHKEAMARIEHARELLLLHGKDVSPDMLGDTELSKKILAAYERAEQGKQPTASGE